MAGEVDDIVQNIVLTGNEEVSEAFNKIQEAGSRAFEGVARSIELGATSFAGFSAAIAGAGAAIGIVAVGMTAFVRSTAESVSSISDLADRLGTTTENITGLRAAFAAGGVGAGEMDQAFRRLSVTVSQAWTEIKQQSRQSADQLRGDALSIIQAQQALADAQKAVADQERDLAQQRKQNTNTVESAELALDQARLNSQKLQGFDTSAAQQRLDLEKADLEVKRAALELENARRAKAEEAENQEKQRVENAIKAQQAQLALNQAIRKEEDDRKNDINNVINAVKQVAAGNADALKSINASVDNIIKGIVGAAGESRKAIGDLRGDIHDLASTGPDLEAALTKAGQVLKNIEDPALRNAVAMRLFRNATQDFINVISDPAKVQEFKNRIHELGLEITEADRKIAEEFREALFTLQNDVQLVADKIGSAFGPSLTQLLLALDESITSSKGSFESWAQTINQSILPAVESFRRVVKGAPSPELDQWLVDIIDTFKEFGSAVGSVATQILRVFNLLVEGVQKLLDVFNKLAGTDFTPLSLALQVILGPIKAVAEALNLAATALKTLFDLLGAGGGDKQTAVFDGMLAKLKAIKEMLSGDIKKGFEDYKKAAEEQAAREKQIDDQNKQIADDQKARQKELTDAQRDEANERAGIKKKSDKEIEDSDKRVVEVQSGNKKQLFKVNKDALDQETRDVTDLNKLQQTIKPLTGVTQGPNGTTVITPGVATQDSINRALGIQQNTFDQNTTQKQINDALNRVPLPQPRPPEADRQQEVETLKQGVSEGLKDFNTNEKPFSVPPDSRSPTGIPTGQSIEQNLPRPPEQVPLAPELQPQSLTNQLNQLPQVLKDAFQGLVDQSIFKGKSDIQPTQEAPPVQDLSTSTGDIQQLGSESSSAGEKVGQLGNAASTAGDKFTELNDALQQVPDQFSGIGQQVQQLMQEALQQATPQDLSSVSDSLTQTADAISGSGQEVVNALSQVAEQLIAAAAQASGGNDNHPITAAGGGLIWGAGTETSDSIHALLSRNEFVQPARAVRHYGVQFMEAVRTLQLPKFAEGGLVFSSMLPRFADGGQVIGNSGSLPHFGTADFRTNGGDVQVVMRADSFRALQRRAITSRITSTSKNKPEFVR